MRDGGILSERRDNGMVIERRDGGMVSERLIGIKYLAGLDAAIQAADRRQPSKPLHMA